MLDAIFAAIDRQASYYRGALSTYALVIEGGHQVLLRADLRFSASLVEARPPRDYTGLLLREEWLNLEDAKKFIENLTRAPDSLPYGLKGAMEWAQAGRSGIPLSSHDPSLGLEAAAFVYTYSSGASTVEAPDAPQVHLDYPVFSDGWEAVDDWVGSRQYSHLNRRAGVQVVVPDVRAAISKIRLTNDEMEVVVKPMALGIGSLKVRANLAYGGSESEVGRFHPLFEEKDQRYLAALPRGIPQRIQLFLLDTRDSSIVDYQRFYSVVSLSSGLLTVEVPSRGLIDMIAGGESDQVELKEKVTDKAVDTILAFANGVGGLAIIGVDDERQVVGVDNPAKEGSRLVDMVNSFADPVPLFDLSYQVIHDKDVIIVRVPAGDNPPYTYRGRGVHVRRKDRNGFASRSDLDAMYAKRGGRAQR